MQAAAPIAVNLRRRFQWRLRTWFAIVAILGWTFAIRPSYIVETSTLELPHGKQSVSTLQYLNPHYFGPLFALTAFASWLALSSGTRSADLRLTGDVSRRHASRRWLRRIAIGISLSAATLALAAYCAWSIYGAAHSTPANSPFKYQDRMMAANASLLFYASVGVVLGTAVWLFHSRPHADEPHAARG